MTIITCRVAAPTVEERTHKGPATTSAPYALKIQEVDVGLKLNVLLQLARLCGPGLQESSRESFRQS